MELSFTKHNSQWVIRADAHIAPGTTIDVPKRGGGSKPVTIGPQVGTKSGDYLFAIATQPRAPAAPTQAVGDLSGILAIFNTARRHLKHPSIVLDGFRVARAGDSAREPGSLTITSVERTHTDRFGNDARDWYGRVSLDGTFQPARQAPADLGEKLRAFAADPAGVAAAYGHLHGRCCFCNTALTDERSTSVGYGPICADHFGLPWGARPAPTRRAASAGPLNDIEAAADRRFDEADERAMQEMEARADREGTIRDERNKHRARAMMERRA
ncbi:MAG TPA: DUF6011 domain-containing protein [Casimicrobiaceae bacterium]|jgi:Family of unknown function (DUF6011)|nr:DUF6011 domain-containing protein [Casimicrobiaceae bacterium]